MSALTLEVEVDGVLRRLVVERGDEGCVVHMDGRAIPVDICEPLPGVLSLLIRNIGDDSPVGLQIVLRGPLLSLRAHGVRG